MSRQHQAKEVCKQSKRAWRIGESMSSVIYERDIDDTKEGRDYLVRALELALSKAKSGSDEISLEYEGLEISWDYRDKSLLVID